MIDILILAVVFFLGLLFGVPIVFTLVGSVLIYLFLVGIPSELLGIRAAGFLSSFSIVTVPLFIFAALLMNGGGSTRRLLNWCMAFVGWLRGGLALVNVTIGFIFGGISGAALSEAASLGTWLIPAMKEKGYPASYAAAVTAAASTISPILPPGTSLIIAAIIASQSILGVFLAAIVPGILMGIALAATVYIIAIVKGHPRGNPLSVANIISASKAAAVDLVMPVLIIGGIRFGWYTATEGAAVAVGYAILVGLFVHRELNFGKIKSAALQTTLISGAILVVTAVAATLGWIMSVERIPQHVTEFALALNVPDWGMVAIILVLLLLIGAVMDGLSALIIFLPVLLPLAVSLGMHPVQMTVFVVFVLTIGVLTPPLGVCLFITAAIAKVKVSEVAIASIPFVIILSIIGLLIGYYQPITMWLVNL